jgi:hypothetical protein
VPCHHGGQNTTLLLPQPPQSDTGGQQQRLRALREIDRGGIALLAQLPEIVTQLCGRFGKGVENLRMSVRQLGQHADFLGTLAGKNESELLVQSERLSQGLALNG